jgi:hypothetical protein
MNNLVNAALQFFLNCLTPDGNWFFECDESLNIALIFFTLNTQQMPVTDFFNFLSFDDTKVRSEVLKK